MIYPMPTKTIVQDRKAYEDCIARNPGGFIALERQRRRIAQRRKQATHDVMVCGQRFTVLRGVYDTGLDTELMAEAVVIGRGDTLLDVGCGNGAMTLLVSSRAKSCLGIDINRDAVQNAVLNAAVRGVDNVKFAVSDVFQRVRGRFDVITCNPPYNNRPVRDLVERMFWDPDNEMKQRLFAGVRKHLRERGRVYFGWADFADLDQRLPLALARRSGLILQETWHRPSESGPYRFIVHEFRAP